MKNEEDNFPPTWGGGRRDEIKENQKNNDHHDWLCPRLLADVIWTLRWVAGQTGHVHSKSVRGEDAEK